MELRPLSLGELLDHTFGLYRSHFWLFVGIAALPQFPFLALYLASESVGGMSRGLGSSGGGSRAVADASILAGVLVAAALLMVALLVAYVLAQAATVFAVSEIYLGRRTSIRQAYGHVRGRFWTLAALLLMVGLATLGGLIFLVVPGILVLLSTSLGVPAAVLENLKARPAISRSLDLTKGNWGRIFMIFLLFFVLSMVASILFEFPFVLAQRLLFQHTLPAISVRVMGQLASLASKAVVAPLATIALALAYFDIRVRKEAFDLQAMMSALEPARSVPPGTAPPPLRGS